MSQDYEATGQHILNEKYAYQRKLMRDSVEGSTAIKLGNLMYLPMPSSFKDLPAEAAPSLSMQNVSRFDTTRISATNLPYYYNNPAYMPYLQRARYPDLTASILIGLLGFAAKEPEILLPPELEYLEQNADGCGRGLEQLFWIALEEVLLNGKFCFVVDVDETDNTFCVVPYCGEANSNWLEEKVNRKIEMTRCSFIQGDSTLDEEHIKEYILRDGVIYVKSYIGEVESEEIVLSVQGKTFDKMPVFFAGSVKNVPESFISPLIGVADCALEIYQIHADLRQAEYMTCNPTLFVYGINENEKPTTMGTQVVHGLRNPAARAEYPKTDTSALSHLNSRIVEIKKEAIEKGASFLITGSESGEALSMRQANKGTNLIHCLNNVSKAINGALDFICELKGIELDEEIYQPNLEFVEMILTAQDVTALVSAWVQAAIPHDILLDNLRDAGYIKSNLDNEKIKQMILAAPPAVPGVVVTEDGKDSFGNQINPPVEEKEEDGEEETKGKEKPAPFEKK